MSIWGTDTSFAQCSLRNLVDVMKVFAGELGSVICSGIATGTDFVPEYIPSEKGHASRSCVSYLVIAVRDCN